jgi:multidrug efflux pump subunit AcrA (membrane-fusion protein)
MKIKIKKIKTKLTSIWSWFKQLKNWKKSLLILLVGLAIFLVRPQSDEEVISYQTQAASIGSVSEVISETGEIMSTGKTDITSTITGIVTETYVENGDEVAKDKALFKVTSSATAEERAKAYAAYLAAKNTLDAASRNKQTYESDMWQAHETFEADSLDTELSVDDPIFIQTERDWQAAEKKYLDQDQVISQAQAAVSNTWLSYQATIDGVVKAPIGGTVANLSVSAGQQVTVNDTALMISSTAETWIKLAVSEADVTTIEPGQTADVAVDALRDSSFAAVVKRVDEFGTDNSGIVTYNVYLALQESADQIKPTMTVQVDINTQSKDEALVVPNSAIKPYQGSKAVQVLSQKTGQAIYLPVEIGIEGEKFTEIISGLKEGQQVITGQGTDGNNSEKNSSSGIFPVPGGGGSHK